MLSRMRFHLSSRDAFSDVTQETTKMWHEVQKVVRLFSAQNTRLEIRKYYLKQISSPVFLKDKYFLTSIDSWSGHSEGQTRVSSKVQWRASLMWKVYGYDIVNIRLNGSFSLKMYVRTGFTQNNGFQVSRMQIWRRANNVLWKSMVLLFRGLLFTL